MRLTPAQIGMLELLGVQFSSRPKPMRDRVQAGHTLLIQITGQDFGFDPQRWHEYLRETGAGGYRWSNKHLGMPKRIAQALQDPEWQEVVRTLQEAVPNAPG